MEIERNKENEKIMFSAKAVLIDVNVGDRLKILLNEQDAWKLGLKAIDKVILHCPDGKQIHVDVDLTTTIVDRGEIGIFKDVLKHCKIQNGELISISFEKINFTSIVAIRKKLRKQKLKENEIEQLVKDIVRYKISDTLLTYFTAASFFYTRKKEMFRFAKYSAIYGNSLKFDKPTAVKYGIGGVPGNETTLIIAPILSSLGILYPKTFTKAITSPAATGECAETLMNINFDTAKIQQLISQTNAALVLGKDLFLAPANDRIISISYPLGTESYTRMVTSIVAKLFAGGINFVVIDIPYGPYAKIKNKKLARKIKKYFVYLGKKLGMKINVVMTKTKDIVGRGVGAKLQVKDVLAVLRQEENRPLDLEQKAVKLAVKLYSKVKKISSRKAKKIILETLKSGKAYEQMKKIILAQGGKLENLNVKLKGEKIDIFADRDGKIKEVNFLKLKQLARSLGCPVDYDAGIRVYKKLGDKVKKGEKLFTIYSTSKIKLEMGKDFVQENPFFIY